MVLLIGGSGFIGSSIAEHLLNKGYRVRVFDMVEPDKIHTDKPDTNSFQFVKGNYREIDQYPQIFDDVDYVFHLVHTTIPSTSMHDIPYDIESNVIPSVKLLKMCVGRDIKKFIFISSGGTVYGVPEYLPVDESHPTNPISSYGITKLAIEKYVNLFNHIHDLNGFILRLSNPYGIKQDYNKSQGVIPIFLNLIKEGKPIEIWGNGEVIRDYIYIGDVCNVIEKIIENEEMPKGVYNIGSGDGISLNKLILTIGEVIGYKFDIKYKDKRNIDVPKIVLDISKIHKEICWKPETTLKCGIKTVWKRLRRAN